ncbi:MAG TPA: histidine phosphatase family protein [Hyphomonadaceae bacterium]|nr:histidine phosphatase family protein [Hyphomonadaceae bacterium]
MRQLVLMRHAKAVPPDEADDDFERALADQGREAAPRVAKALAEAGADPQVVLVSDAKRTRETWELVKPALGKVEVQFLRTLYLCPAETLMEAAEKANAERVMLVAHNPGMHELATRLAFRNNELDARVRAKFPTAAAALFERKGPDSSWKLKAYLTPKGVDD